MPNCLSVERPRKTLAVIREWSGARVPWEVESYLADYERSRDRGGVFDLSHWSTVEIAGPDAADYLHRMSTADVRRMEPGELAHAAFLTGKANPIAMGWLLRSDAARFEYIVPPPLGDAAAEHIEKFHFAESFVTRDASASRAVFGLWDPRGEIVPAMGVSRPGDRLRVATAVWKGIPLEVWKDDSRGPLFWVKMERGLGDAFLDALAESGIELLGQRVFEYHRIAAGVPQVGVELGDKALVLEGNFDRVVARNKGCYPGQEVVERIFTYGQVNRKLMPVTVSGGPVTVPAPVMDGDQSAGTLVGYADDPTAASSSGIGLALLHKKYWNSAVVLTLEGGAKVEHRSAAT